MPIDKKAFADKNLNKSEVRAALSGEHRSRGRGRSQAEIRESYAKYYQNKKKAVDLESRNTKYLVLWPASDKDINKEYQFYNMGGNSAVIYVHEIGPRIGRTPSLRIDMDNGSEKFRTGVCSIRDLDKLTEKLAEIGIKQVKFRSRGYEDFVFFRLNREYSLTEVKEMLKQEGKNLEQLNKLLYAQVLYPDVHKLMLDLVRLVPVKIKNMDKTYREIVGDKMLDTLMALIRVYTGLTHGDIEEVAGAKGMIMEIDMLFAEISMMNELKLWEVSTCTRIGAIATGMRQTLKGKIVNKDETTR